MTWRMPGSRPWMTNTVGMLQLGDWASNRGAGIMKYDDGTLWYWNGEMNHPSLYNQDVVYSHVVINELAPDSKAWEQLTPDLWQDDDESDVESTGVLAEDLMQYDQWYVVHDGGGDAFWFPLDDVINSSHYKDLGFFVTHKESRTWEYRLLSSGVTAAYLATPVMYGGYIWYLQRIGNSYDDPTITALFRMNVTPPYTSTEVKRWIWNRPVGPAELADYLDTTDPATGRARWFDLPYAPYVDDASLGVSDDGYLYIAEDVTRSENDGGWKYWNFSWIKRMELPDGEWELLYYAASPKSANGQPFSYNIPGGYVNDRTDGPLPIGMGFRSNWLGDIKLRDGWLYYVDSSNAVTALTQQWYGGQAFCRIHLSHFENAPVQHNSESPIIEMLSMTTGPQDSAYQWDANYPGWWWRDGVNSIHAYIESGWYFDDDGSIVFIHTEYPGWYGRTYSGWYPPYIMSRLSPPTATSVTLNLVFEGNVLKGYGHARSVPTKTAIGSIEMSE